MDVVLSFIFLAGSPVIAFFQDQAAGFFRNIFRVISGRYSWVGYHGDAGAKDNLPEIRPGVLSPLDTLGTQQLDAPTIRRLNGLYAKDYRVVTDLAIIKSGFRKLGRLPVEPIQ